METMIALSTIEIELIEPVSELYDMAEAVPIAWDPQPNPMPRLASLLILNSWNKNELVIAPLIPAIITKTTARGTMPSMDWAISIATGAVTDFGVIE